MSGLRTRSDFIESCSPNRSHIALIEGHRGGLGPSNTRRDLKLHQCHSLQRHRVSLAFLGGAKDGFSYGLHMCGTDRVRERCNRSVERNSHDANSFGRKRCVRKVLHLKSASIKFLKARRGAQCCPCPIALLAWQDAVALERSSPSEWLAAFRRSHCRLRRRGRGRFERCFDLGGS